MIASNRSLSAHRRDLIFLNVFNLASATDEMTRASVLILLAHSFLNVFPDPPAVCRSPKLEGAAAVAAAEGGAGNQLVPASYQLDLRLVAKGAGQ